LNESQLEDQGKLEVVVQGDIPRYKMDIEISPEAYILLHLGIVQKENCSSALGTCSFVLKNLVNTVGTSEN